MKQDSMLKESSSPAATDAITSEKCNGCGIPINDRYYLLAADQAWHVRCLKCCQCLHVFDVDNELSCFVRDGNIYCKNDYYRLFSIRNCARCGLGINSSELIMRAKGLVFHLSCFSCYICNIILNTGDTAGIKSGQIFCSEHYEDILSEANSIQTHFFSGSPQKGRPRKRKSSPHHETEHTTRTTPIRLDLLHSELSAGSLNLSSFENRGRSQSPRTCSEMMSSNSRSKRMRTSFKHHQLRTMKSYFAINQNPDAKDLKQLAQKTGLSKRVLQVWFQNARAKFRRNVMRQDGQSSNQTSTQSLVTLMQQGSNSSSMNIESDSLEDMHHMTFAELY